ncbi:hypothetical protein BOX15_Mlig019220g1, partial [Macrostomum lignano]
LSLDSADLTRFLGSPSPVLSTSEPVCSIQRQSFTLPTKTEPLAMKPGSFLSVNRRLCIGVTVGLLLETALLCYLLMLEHTAAPKPLSRQEKTLDDVLQDLTGR